MARKFFYGDDPLGKKAKKQTGSVTEGLGLTGGAKNARKKLFGVNASAFIQKKMAEQQAKADDKDDQK